MAEESRRAERPEPELESRREMYRAIRASPGTHFRGLLDQLEYAQGTLQYHLRWLEDEGLVQSDDDGEYTRYYTTGFEPADRAVMNALRREYSRRIVACLAADGPQTTSELAERLGRAPSTISWHLSRLHEAGVVTKERAGQSVEYELEDPDRVMRLYTVHRKSLTDRLVDNVLGIWNDY